MKPTKLIIIKMLNHLKSLPLCASLLGASGTSFATDSSSVSVKYDFSKNSVDFPGVFKADPKEPKSGLNAEILARQEGISSLENQLKKECSGSERSNRLIPNWQSSVRSQGSELFADGSLKIYLSSSFGNLFRKPKEVNAIAPTTADGKPILFTLGNLPSLAVNCGTVKLDFNSRITELVPVAKSPKDTYYKISILVGAQNVLKIPSSEATAVLEKSNVYDANDKKLLLESLPIFISDTVR